jgi:N-(2-amino-2-carboxyethyl)-L-glutamate synthase
VEIELDGVLGAIGRTPIVRLRRLFPGAGFRLFAKLEGLNPGGSLKDRPALAILRSAVESGQVRPGRNVVVESSSGNFAIGLAQACCYLGLRLICVVDPKTTAENLAILCAYGAEIDMVREPDRASGEYLPTRLRRVRELVETTPGAFWPNQYANPLHPLAHHTTMAEIVGRLGARIDLLLCATSTCGTLRGCAEHIRRHRLATRLVAVDAAGSVIFDEEGGGRRKRLIPGHGAAVRPALYRPGLAHEVVHVSDLDCVVGCRRLVRCEALLAGGSSGALVAAVERIASTIPNGATCVLVLPDRGERYLDTIYSDAWVADHFGDVAHLWRGQSPPPALAGHLPREGGGVAVPC